MHVAPAPLPEQLPTVTVPTVPATVTPIVTSLPTAGHTPTTTTKQVVLDRLALKLHGGALRLTWRASAGTTPTRYLVVWRTRSSAKAKPVVHRSWTTTTTLGLPRATPHTIAVELTAYGAGGKLLRSLTQTVRLTR